AQVDRIASNRRYLTADGKPAFGRTSATRDPTMREKPEGTIDPWLKTLSFWDGDRPVAALSCYATHPMSYYGKGGVSSDFVGLARKRRQGDDPAVFQIYASGCSGNVTAGKYNDGSPDNVPVLDLAAAHLLLLPGESYVEYQLRAQQLRPDSFVVVMGYGESATGYIPTDQAFAEGDSNLHDWCWVAPGSERAMTEALRAAL